MVAVAKPTWEIVWIDDDITLKFWSQKLKDESYVSLDTETWGWQSGDEKLCLIQIGVPSVRKTLLIDALSVKEVEALATVFEDPVPAIVCHNAAFERRQFERYKISINGVIDTIDMAKRLRPDLGRYSLRFCCRYILGLELNKDQQTSDWSLRPLSKEQITYAALDAEITAKLYEELSAMDARLEIDPNLKVPELMRLLAKSYYELMELREPIAAELALLEARCEMLRSRIKALLLNGEPSYDGRYGKASISKVKKTEINPVKLKSELPEIAPLVIVESVDKKKLQALMSEYGIDQKTIDRLTDTVGYIDRLNLTLGEPDEDENSGF